MTFCQRSCVLICATARAYDDDGAAALNYLERYKETAELALQFLREEPIKLIINVEPQKTSTSIDYKLMKRAVYYVARPISSQKEKEFHCDDYNGLKKVYSIWITMDVQNYRANSIQQYSLTEKVLHGSFYDEPKNYDLLKIIILNLGTKKNFQ